MDVRRCFKCKKQLIGGEQGLCPRCTYMIHKGTKFVQKYPIQIALGAVAVVKSPKVIRISKAVLELAKHTMV